MKTKIAMIVILLGLGFALNACKKAEEQTTEPAPTTQETPTTAQTPEPGK
ncbi:MAG: hypothetical protein LHV69_10875 [Elusimicrobia bacterium]|nr:hypothetical protein [Candidatus Obscuribacterium magneticum]